MEISTVCGICGGSCGMKLKVENNVIVKTEGLKEHPVSQGYLCPKGRYIGDIEHSPDRLTRPLKKDAQGYWQEISWSNTLDYMADRMIALKKDYGAETIAVHVGQAGVHKEFTPYVNRFCKAFGTPNFSTSGSHCHYSKKMANTVTYGFLPTPDYRNSKCIVLWGFNPSEATPPLLNLLNEGRRKGARLVVIDPRKTALADKADLHLQVRPGTDGALALGMMNVIISEKLYDGEFVEDWTVGFGKLVDLVKEYTPEKAADITWVPAELIREAARLYAANTPACIAQGIALELHTNGFQAVRAISILQAITRNLDVTGGALFAPAPQLASMELKDFQIQTRAIGQERFPLFFKHTGEAQANIYSDAILDGNPYPLRGMVVAGSNPLLTWPNAGRLRNGLEKLEFLAVIDHFMTDTAKMAHVVLPAASFFSRDELWDTAHGSGELKIGFAPKILDNDEIMTDWAIWRELAIRMGLESCFPWKNETDALNSRLRPLDLEIETLRRNPEGCLYGQQKEKKYLKDGFKTPSGKVEIYSKELAELGYDSLPVFHEPHESPAKPGLAGDYSLVLTTGARTLPYLHSRYRNIPLLNKLNPEACVEIHPDKAREMALSEGDMVIVRSPRGCIEVKARITDRVHPRTIFIQHGWGEGNANILTDNEALDPVTGFPADRALMADILKA